MMVRFYVSLPVYVFSVFAAAIKQRNYEPQSWSPLSASLALGAFPLKKGKEAPVHRRNRHFLPPWGKDVP